MNFSDKILKQFSVPEPLLKQIPIEYKKVDPEVFKARGYQTEYVELEATNGYISDQILNHVSVDQENTVIINVGLGQGKSYASQQMMKHYYQNGYIVMIASPFKSLVLKDYTYLTETAGIPDDAIFNYNQLEKDRENIKALEGKEWSNYFKDISQKPVHILTINSLLGNPGENAFLQNSSKREYLNNILWYCKKKNKKIVFFFDEIHETVPNFQNELMFLLRRWKDVTLKCFILTATFTEPTYIVAMHIAYLTNDKFKIIESPRVKNDPERLAELELYFCKEKYSSKKGFGELDYIQAFIEKGEYEHYHILSYSEKIAKSLYDKEMWKGNHNVNLTIGSNENNIDRRLNNIGTTFKTGININKPDALIIVCPSKFGDFPSKGSSGIFYDGVPSILQSFARLRNGGKILVFFPPLNNYINTISEEEEELNIKQYSDFIKSCFPDLDMNVSADNSSYATQFHAIENIYKKMLERVHEEKEIYNNSDSNINRPEIQYPTLDNFILNKGQQYLVYSQEKYGKNTAPFIVWAAFHNQFQNCTLKYITTHEYDYKEFISSRKTFISDIVSFFEPVDKEEIRLMHPYKALEYCMSLFKGMEISGTVYKVKCIIDGKERGDFPYSTQLAQWVVSYLQAVIHKKEYRLQKVSYLHTNIARANRCPKESNSNLVKAYQVLGSIGMELNDLVASKLTKNIESDPENVNILLPKKNYEEFKNLVGDVLNSSNIDLLKKHLDIIVKQDKIISTKKISVLQKLDFDNLMSAPQLNTLYSFLKELFLDSVTVRKGKKNMDQINFQRNELFKRIYLKGKLENPNMLDYNGITVEYSNQTRNKKI